MVSIHSKKNEDSEDVLELRDECNLSLVLGVKYVCGSKTHLEADNCCSKFNGSENKTGYKANEEAKQQFRNDKQCKR